MPEAENPDIGPPRTADRPHNRSHSRVRNRPAAPDPPDKTAPVRNGRLCTPAPPETTAPCTTGPPARYSPIAVT